MGPCTSTCVEDHWFIHSGSSPQRIVSSKQRFQQCSNNLYNPHPRDRQKPGFAFSAENETNAESGSQFSAQNRNENETAASFSAEDVNEINIQDADEVSVT